MYFIPTGPPGMHAAYNPDAGLGYMDPHQMQMGPHSESHFLLLSILDALFTVQVTIWVNKY